MIDKFIPYILGIKPYDLQAHVWRDELTGAGWINLSNEDRKEIKDDI
jgi:hypothetical protein